ncbi:UNVERIFIED_CONTAM: hypothetical protein NY603_38150, partial [Bacteroidetes bacterium 56_B9]
NFHSPSTMRGTTYIGSRRMPRHRFSQLIQRRASSSAASLPELQLLLHYLENFKKKVWHIH